MTFTSPATHHPVAVPIPTLVMLTVHQAGTAMEAPSPRPFWQALILLPQMKKKPFTRQPKNIILAS